jgi:xylan 1,4-beta-xylosidase
MTDAVETVQFTVDLASAGRALSRSWELAVGCGDAWSILRADMQAQLRRAVEQCGFRYVRAHGILNDQLQSIRRDRDGALVYNWQLVDAVYDTLLALGLRPFVELGFMPQALASGTQAVFYYRGNVTPPADYDAWREYIGALVGHWRERYGAEELRAWYFEVWNEANLGGFWSSTRDEYFRLYAETVRALKEVDAGLRVGGPASTRGEWLPEFMAFCREQGAEVDFASTHVYPDDDDFGKVDPDYRAIYERGDYLETLVERTAAALRDERPVGAAGRLEAHWTEWNASWRPGNPIHDTTNQAAYVVRALHRVAPLVDSFAYWTVSDIFNEFPYPRAELHGGYGMQTLSGLPKPVFHAFALLHRLGDIELDVTRRGDDTATIGLIDAWATRSQSGAQFLLSNYTPPGQTGQSAPTRSIGLTLHGLPRRSSVELLRIDADHANLLGAWQAIGSPPNPTPAQVADLASRCALQPSAAPPLQQAADSSATLTLDLPPGSVALLDLRAT